MKEDEGRKRGNWNHEPKFSIFVKDENGYLVKDKYGDYVTIEKSERYKKMLEGWDEKDKK